MRLIRILHNIFIFPYIITLSVISVAKLISIFNKNTDFIPVNPMIIFKEVADELINKYNNEKYFYSAFIYICIIILVML